MRKLILLIGIWIFSLPIQAQSLTISLESLNVVGWSPDSSHFMVTDSFGLRLFTPSLELVYHDEDGFIDGSLISDSISKAFSPSGRYFAYLQRYRTHDTYQSRLVLIDIDEDKQHILPISDLTTRYRFSPDEDYLAVAQHNYQVTLIDLRTLEVSKILTMQNPGTFGSNSRKPSIYTLYFSPDNQYLATVGGIKTQGGLDMMTTEMMFVQMWDVTKGRELWYEQQLNEGAVDYAGFLEDSPQFMTHSGKALAASRDLITQVGVVRLRDVDSGEIRYETEVGRKLRFTPDYSILLSANHFTAQETFPVEIVSLVDNEIRTPIANNSRVFDYSLTDDGQKVVIATTPTIDKLPQVLFWQTNNDLQSIVASHPVVISSDGQYIATGGGEYRVGDTNFSWSRADSLIRLWEGTSGKLLYESSVESPSPFGLHFSPDNSHLLIVDRNFITSITIVDVVTAE